LKLDNIFTDERGNISALTNGLVTAPEVAILRTKAGYARGGCLHHLSQEHLCVLEGMIAYVYGDSPEAKIADSNVEFLNAGQSISIAPNVPHYYISITDSAVIEWGPTADEKNDRHTEYRAEVIRINEHWDKGAGAHLTRIFGKLK